MLYVTPLDIIHCFLINFTIICLCVCVCDCVCVCSNLMFVNKIISHC